MKLAAILLLSLALLAPKVRAEDSTSCNQKPPGSRANFSVYCFEHSPIEAKDDRVYFPYGSNELTPEAVAILDRQAFALLAYPKLWVDIVGYVDRHEAATPEGLKIGYKRALAVRDYLILRGVAAERISTYSHGDRNIIPRDNSDTAMAAMRFAKTDTRDP